MQSRVRGRKTNNFNPRSREGSDLIDCVRYPVHLISIHAPARGATNVQLGNTGKMTDFNPRSREGSDAGLPEVKED